MTLPAFKASKQSIIVLAVVASVIFLLGGFAYFMTSKQLGTVVAERDDKQRQWNDGKKVASQLKQAEAKCLQAQSDISYLETSVTSQKYIPTMLKQIEVLASSLHLNVVSVRPQVLPPAPPPTIKRTSEDPQAAPQPGDASAAPKVIASKPYDEMLVNVEVEGSYWNARNFISRLTKFPKILAVSAITMSPSDTSTSMSSPKLLVTLSLKAFVFPVEDSKKDQPKPEVKPLDPKTESARGEGRSCNEG